MKNRYPIFAAILGLGVSQLPSVASADVTWVFNSNPANCISTDDPTGNCGNGSNNFASYRTYQGYDGGSAAGTVTVSGWSNTQGSENERLELGQTTHYSGAPNNGGLGVRNADWNSTPSDRDSGESQSPEHAVDNNGRIDYVLFYFNGLAVDLNQVMLGYAPGDADISVLAFTDPGNPTVAGRLASASGEDLTSNGWTVVGNYQVDTSGSSPYVATINAGDIESSYWLISAYNSAFSGFGPSCPTCGMGWKDYFKISALSGHIIPDEPGPGIPAPATLGLIGLGLVGIGYRRRGKKNSA